MSSSVVTVVLPRRLVEVVESMGLDLVDVIVNALSGSVDPSLTSEARVVLAEKYLEEAREYIAKGDAIQASEKMYRVVEECVKALAETLDTPEAQEVRKNGRWFTWLLGSAAKSIADRLGEPVVLEAWAVAYDIHVWGFHEARYGIERVMVGLKYVEQLLNLTRRVLGRVK
ncbi:MAG: PaREP1 family protein [Vulcanisaeta sp.]|nr:PaREP1 family protein [Vulcanisaeta sp.]